MFNRPTIATGLAAFAFSSAAADLRADIITNPVDTTLRSEEGDQSHDESNEAQWRAANGIAFTGGESFSFVNPLKSKIESCPQRKIIHLLMDHLSRQANPLILGQMSQ